MKYIKSYQLLFESNSNLKFIKQPTKKGAKTETYNVVDGKIVIGQIKWSSRIRGYSFLPSNANTTKVKNFTADLMKKWRAKRKKEKK